MTIDQSHAQVTLDPYLVAGFIPMRMPAVAALGKSAVSVATVSTVSAITDQLSVDLGATCRWVADPAKLVDNGDGTVDWHPSQGSNMAPVWRFDAASQPVKDPGYSYAKADGSEAGFPAFLFNGGMWAKLFNFPADLASWTAAVVLKLRKNPGAYADIFASQVTWADGNTGADSAVQYRPGWGSIRTIKRGYTREDPITLTGRPLILVAKSDAHRTYTVIGDDDWSAVGFRHDPVTSYDMNWYLGRASDVYYNSLTLRADILDVVLWNTALADWQVRWYAHRLNHVYEVVS